MSQLEITLSQNQVALVDDEDYEYLNQWKWYALRDYNTYYAVRQSPRDPITHKQTCILMHRLIMNAPDGVQIDHWDGDGLNNQKSNLRVATGSQNQMNREKSSNNTSGYKGVYWTRHAKKWKAKICVNRKQIHLGYFTDPIEAAKAYDRKTLEIFGEFAHLNFPEGRKK